MFPIYDNKHFLFVVQGVIKIKTISAAKKKHFHFIYIKNKSNLDSIHTFENIFGKLDKLLCTSFNL